MAARTRGRRRRTCSAATSLTNHYATPAGTCSKESYRAATPRLTAHASTAALPAPSFLEVGGRRHRGEADGSGSGAGAREGELVAAAARVSLKSPVRGDARDGKQIVCLIRFTSFHRENILIALALLDNLHDRHIYISNLTPKTLYFHNPYYFELTFSNPIPDSTF